MLSSATVGSLSLDDFVKATSQVYRHHDEKRSVWDIWLHTCHHASSLSRSIQRESTDVKKEIAHLSMWLFTFIQRTRASNDIEVPGDMRKEETLVRIRSEYSEILWRNFPCVCPDCYWRRTEGAMQSLAQDETIKHPCDCKVRDMQDTKTLVARMSAVRTFAQLDTSNPPRSIDEWQEMFSSIIPVPTDASKACLGLLDAMGQVGDGILRLYTFTAEEQPTKDHVQYKYVRFEREIAEVTAFVFVLAQTIKNYSSAPPLSQMIWDVYGSTVLNEFYCPKCENCPCSCEIRFVPNDVSAEEVREAAEHD